MEPQAITAGHVRGGSLAIDDAVRALSHLVESGHELVVVGANGDVALPIRPLVGAVVRVLPQRHDAPAWYLTTDVARCGRHSPRLQTVLVGAVGPTGGRARSSRAAMPVQRCDRAARDLRNAVLEILAAEAMPRSRG